VNNSPKVLPALYGGIIIAVVSSVPFLNWINCCCCAGVMLGGFLSVFFYKNNLPPTVSLTSADAIQLGALAGLFGAIIGTGIHALFFSLIGNVSGQTISDFLEGLGSGMPSRELSDLEEGLSKISRMAPVAILWTFLSSLFIDPLFGLLGALIGHGVFRKKGPPDYSMPLPPPIVPPSQ